MVGDVVIEPRREKGEPALPECGLLAVNPGDARLFQEIAGSEQLSRHFLFHSSLYSDARLFLAGPAIGAPMAVMCLEKCIALGATNVLHYGWCGSLSPKIRVGDLILPTEAVSEEGTSRHYPVAGPIAPDDGLRNALKEFLVYRGLSFAEGPLWTTDAPYRETLDKVDRYGRQGVVGVEMEYAALCAASRFRGAAFAGIMLVSDEPWRRPWKPEYFSREFRKRSREIVLALVEFIKTLKNE